ncbi:hypothetical protein Tco_1247370 [Tanacetum coccineum]
MWGNIWCKYRPCEETFRETFAAGTILAPKDDGGESKKGVSDELSAVSEEDAPEVSEDVFDVDLSKRKEVEKTLDEERVNEEDNVEWSPENLRVLAADVEAREQKDLEDHQSYLEVYYKEREHTLWREFEARKKELELEFKRSVEEKSGYV